MRKLASVQVISSLAPIDGADAIEVATVLGWHVVVKKGEFSVGDRCVYCEIDSVLPEKDEFEFLRKQKFRIRTVRLRGQISQGICFQLSILPDGDYRDGDDVTEILGITKYEPQVPACLSGEAIGLFPSFIPKTDEVRIQSCPRVLDRWDACWFVATEKLDGSSATFFLRDGEFGVCSRNLQLQESDTNAFWRYARSADIEAKLRGIGRNIAIQGELIGPGIQGNRYKLSEPRVYFFNVFDIDSGSYLSHPESIGFINGIDLNFVPVLDDDEFATAHPLKVDDLVKQATGRSLIADTKREGVVMRLVWEDVDPDIGRVSFKVINPEFLLKYE